MSGGWGGGGGDIVICIRLLFVCGIFGEKQRVVFINPRYHFGIAENRMFICLLNAVMTAVSN